MIEPTPTRVNPFVKKWENDTLRLTLNEDRTAWSNIHYSIDEAKKACGKTISTRLDFLAETGEYYLEFDLKKFFELEEDRIEAGQALALHFTELGWATIPDELMEALFPPKEAIATIQNVGTFDSGATTIDQIKVSDEEIDLDDAERAAADETAFEKALNGDPDIDPWTGKPRNDEDDPYA